MQSIKHTENFKYIHNLFADIERFYILTSDKRNNLLQNENALFRQEIVFDSAFSTLQSLFNEFDDCNFDFKFDELYYADPLPKYNLKNIIVLFSGGKDSTATAIHYKNRGWNVYLYHLRGVNKEYPNEFESAKSIAEQLDLPLYVDTVYLSGKKSYVEHPMKNIIIATMALQYGILNNIGIKIACGNYRYDYADKSDFHINGADKIDTWHSYEHIIQTIIPKFNVHVPLRNYLDTINLMLEQPELIKFTSSCMMPHRFRAYKRDYVQNKHGIQLMTNRCGCCVKCCREYIYLVDFDVIELDESYYTYCLQICYNNIIKEGEVINTISELWKANCLYPIEQSKLYDRLIVGEIKHKKVCV